eukprot:6080249-Pyramimonas_sp.AAC.1
MCVWMTSVVVRMSGRIVRTRTCRAKFRQCAAPPAARGPNQSLTWCIVKSILIARVRNSATM